MLDINEEDDIKEYNKRSINTRRFQGEFFTPTPWVIEAHKMIEKEFGSNWKEEYIVWDPAWGTGNLTRDYKFKELYVSTLNASDIGIAEQRGYNPEAIKFQFDFLNDPYEKLPKGLRNAIKSGKKIIVLMNPPYGTAAAMFSTDRKTSISDSACKNRMKVAGIGRCCEQLYAQFVFRICEFNTEFGTNISFGMYSPSLFLSGPSYDKFREKLLQPCFDFRQSILFRASHFSNTAGNWAILFSLWKKGTHLSGKYPTSVKAFNDRGEVGEIRQKTLYVADNPANKWCRSRGKNTTTFPNLSSAMRVRNEKSYKSNELAIGYFFNKTNNVESNGLNVSLFSTTYFDGHGTPVIEENFKKVVALFTARKSITSNWVIGKDEYIVPNTEHPDYGQWNNDCLVYSLFNNSSNQSSLRNIEYKDKTWDIKNQWFWMSRDRMIELSEEHNFDALYQDARTGSEERFVFNKLKELELSDDAAMLLELSKDLIEDSFEFREMLHQEHPEYHLNTWDAGWYQIKLILKEFMPDDLKMFREEYKEFEKRMREGVYKFGFLRK